MNLFIARRTDCSDTPICRAISAWANPWFDVNSSVHETATQASRGSRSCDMNASTDLRIFNALKRGVSVLSMVIGKRFDRIDRMGVIGCCVPIRWVKKFGLVEVFHAGVSKSGGFPFSTWGGARRITKPEKINPDGEGIKSIIFLIYFLSFRPILLIGCNLNSIRVRAGATRPSTGSISRKHRCSGMMRMQ